MNASTLILIVVLIAIALWVAIKQKWIELPSGSFVSNPNPVIWDPSVPVSYPLYYHYDRRPYDRWGEHSWSGHRWRR